MTNPTRSERLALFAALSTTFAGLHGLGDHWINPAEGVSTSQGVSVREHGRIVRAVDVKNSRVSDVLRRVLA
jgi:hypothetical protein